MTLKAGVLRHRVDIEQKQKTQDSTGDLVVEWVSFVDNVPAAIEPLSCKEFLSAQATQAQVIARITIRYRPGLDASMRINHNGTIYNIAGFLADKDSGLEYLTIPVSAGVNEG